MQRSNSRFWPASAEAARITRNEMRFAGRWYPREPRELRALLGVVCDEPQSDVSLLAESSPARGATLAIFPHAGLVYSARGQRATWHHLRAHGCARPRAVLLISPSHYHPVPADTTVGAPFATHETPLGECDGAPYPVGDRIEPEWICGEHGVELLLPGIRCAIGATDATGAPGGTSGSPVAAVVCGPFSSPATCRAAAGRIIGQLKDAGVSGSLLIAVSSDATHYGARFGHQPFGDAMWSDSGVEIEAADRALIGAALRGTLEEYMESIARNHSTVCGRYALALGCAVQDLWQTQRGATSSETRRRDGAILDYYSSADITATPDAREFVCYVSAIRGAGAARAHGADRAEEPS